MQIKISKQKHPNVLFENRTRAGTTEHPTVKGQGRYKARAGMSECDGVKRWHQLSVWTSGPVNRDKTLLLKADALKWVRPVRNTLNSNFRCPEPLTSPIHHICHLTEDIADHGRVMTSHGLRF